MVVDELFENSVASSPDRIAISYQEHQITYGVLNQKANQLSHYLIKQGVALETPVAICVPRSPDLIIGLLAILKAGGTYVPLDPSYPEKRLNYILKDSQASLLLTTRKLKSKFSKSIFTVMLDQRYGQSITNPDVKVLPENLCYIIYTSGSTGRPKGVACRHDGLVNRLNHPNSLVKVKENNIGCLQTNSVFIDTTWDIFSLLTNNSKLCLYKEEVSRDINQAICIWNKHKISRVTITPSLLQELLSIHHNNIFKRNSLQNINHLKVTGEYLAPSLMQDCNNSQFSTNAALMDCYGATEATSIIYRKFSKNKDNATHYLSNTQIHILDKYLNELPIGSVGEIYIGVVGLARGYINNPSLTSEKFIANPFGDGSRLYRTGDLAKYLPDGNIEFMGRADHQVKIRGFRIELGEIESILQKSIDIQQAVVLAREDIPGQKRLVGYVTLTQESKRLYASQSSYEEELIKSLRELTNSSLPDYMQPSQILVLDSFPLTSNGKLDRKSLPAPEGREGIEGYQPPEGLLEQRLALIWSELLNIEKVGRNDNFFSSGGDSIVSIQLVSRARSAGIIFDVKQVFETPTIHGLVASFYAGNYTRKNEIKVIQANRNKSPLILIHPIVGLSVAYLQLNKLIDHPIYSIDDPYYGEKVSGFKTIAEMATHYINLVKTKQKKGPYYLGGWSFGGIVAIEMARILQEQRGNIIGNIILIDSISPYCNRNKKWKNDDLLIKDKNIHEILMNSNRNNYLLNSYSSKFLDINVSLLKATNYSTEFEELINQRYNGWENYFSKIDVFNVPAHHAELFKDDTVRIVAKYINQILK